MVSLLRKINLAKRLKDEYLYCTDYQIIGVFGVDSMVVTFLKLKAENAEIAVAHVFRLTQYG